MRDLVVQAFVTLDGVMQAPGGPEEDPTGGFEYGGWSVDRVGRDDDGGDEAKTESEPSDYVLGRKTFEIFAGALAARGRPDGQQAHELHEIRGLEHPRKTPTGPTP